MEEWSMQKRIDRFTTGKPIVSIAVTETPERQVYKHIFGCAHMSRVGKILEFSCRQPALCTGAQHQSRWVHILQPPLSRGPLSAVLSFTRQPEEMHHSRTTAVFVCISRMYIMCMCHYSRQSGLHFQPWALFFFRPSFHPVRATAYSVPSCFVNLNLGSCRILFADCQLANS